MSDRGSSSAAETVASSASRISKRFQELSAAGDTGLIVYITAGDPTLAATEKIVLAAANAGADIIELGVPFSDPLADGPVIQRASERALRNGTSLRSVLALVKQLRAKTAVPLVLFSYYNPIYQLGLETFADLAADAGVDGVLATDLTFEEAGEYKSILSAHGLDTIFLAAPTSTDERLAKIGEFSSGFLYLISRTGVTGTRDALPEGLGEFARKAKRFAHAPVAIGFGISLPAHVAALRGLADAAVVGSAIVREIEKAPSADEAARAVRSLVTELKRAGKKSVSNA